MGRLLVVGAPVCGRGWILRRWFTRLYMQWGVWSEEVGIVFHYGPSDDDTAEIIANEARSGRWAFVKCLTDDSDGHLSEGRMWDFQRYEHMARMRNELLEFARSESADLYLSCDTDMLLPANTLTVLLQDIGEFDGIAPLTFMTPNGTGAIVTNGMCADTSRYSPGTGPEQVYACFGVVLMTPQLMTVPYEAHGLGEDLGWAKNVHQARLKLAITPRVRVKHVMQPDHLELFDTRVGF